MHKHLFFIGKYMYTSVANKFLLKIAIPHSLVKHAAVKYMYTFQSPLPSWIHAHLGPRWLIPFPGHFGQSDLPYTTVVYNTKDEEHNCQNETTDLQGNMMKKQCYDSNNWKLINE